MNPLLQALKSGAPVSELAGASPLAARPPSPIQKLRYTHDAMVDQIISNPWISQNDLADLFGMSASWVSTIVCSDLFQSKLAERREALIDPDLRSSIKTQFEGLLSRSMEILRHKLSKPADDVPDQLALQTAKIMSQNLGHGLEKKVSVQETHVHLEQLGENLVGLLRRRKTETYDVQEDRSQPPALEHGSPNGEQGSRMPTPRDQVLELRRDAPSADESKPRG